MNLPQGAPFESLQSQDLDEARALVAGVFNNHRLHHADRCLSLDYRHQHTRAGHLGLGVLEYGARVRIQTEPLSSFYLLQLPLAGVDQQRIGPGVRHNAAGTATVHSPDQCLDMTWSGDCRKLAIRIDRQALEGLACSLSGKAFGLIHWDEQIRTDAGAGLALRLTAEQLLRHLARQAQTVMQPLVWNQWEQMLMLGLLNAHPTALQPERPGPSAQVLPRTVKLADAYMRAHLDEPIDLACLCALTGTSVRALQAGFRQYLGQTPMAHLRHLRLDRVRDELLDPACFEGVTAVAQRWGFGELGRFARQYRERFGELPSQTRQRGG